MNKANVLKKVSERSGVEERACERVLDALEDVLGEELSASKGVGGAFDKLYNVMRFLKERKER